MIWADLKVRPYVRTTYASRPLTDVRRAGPLGPAADRTLGDPRSVGSKGSSLRMKQVVERFAHGTNADQLAPVFARAVVGARAFLFSAEARVFLSLTGARAFQASVWLNIGFRHDAAREPHLHRLAHAEVRLRDAAHFAGETDLAEHRRGRRNHAVADARGDRGQHAEVR